MKILIVSDLHMDWDAARAIAKASQKVPYTFVGGDIGLRRNEDPEAIVDYMALAFKSKKTYVTPGNHDFWPVNLVKLYGGPKSIQVVVDCSVEVSEGDEHYRVWFSPWSTQFGDWNWMVTDEEMDYTIFPLVHMVVTHGPVYGRCDECPNGDHAGSLKLRDKISCTPAKFIFSGHIHGNTYAHQKVGERNFYNTSVLNENYRFKGSVPVFNTETGKMEYWEAD